MKIKTLFTVTSLLLISSTSIAQQTQSLHLKHVMQELSKHMQSTTDAIAREDWERPLHDPSSICEFHHSLTIISRLHLFLGVLMK